MKSFFKIFSLYFFIPFLLIGKIASAQKQDTVKCDSLLTGITMFSANDESNARTFSPIIFHDTLPEAYKFEIYDRWGNIIFVTTNAKQGWNGKKDNKYNVLPDGTYYWLLFYKMPGEIKTHSCNGFVNCIGLREMPPPQVEDTTDCAVYVPNAFTPNGDGMNDYFYPSFTCPLSHYEMWIYDRWGNEIFYTKDIKVGWYGTTKSGQSVEVDTYIYKIKFSYSENEKIRTMMGHVAFIK